MQNRFFDGHPRQLLDVTLANMWETFSYNGTRSLLIFYLVHNARLSTSAALAHYGAFTAMVFATTLPGGFFGDRYFTRLQSVAIGCALVLVGQFGLSAEGPLSSLEPSIVPPDTILFLCLAFLSVGVGLMKPNIYSILGALYDKDSPQRESGFLLFYTGLSISSAVAIVLCGYLAHAFGYSYGFAASAFGMILGLAFLARGWKYLKNHAATGSPRNLSSNVLGGGLLMGLLACTTIAIARASDVGLLLILMVAASIAVIIWYRSRVQCPLQRRQILGILPITGAAALYITLAEQTGGSISLFTEAHVRLRALGMPILASQTQALAPLFLLLLAPPMAFLWQRLAYHGRNPSVVAKFSLGFTAVALAACFLIIPYLLAHNGQRISVCWIVLAYLLITIGELLIIPIGSALVTRLAPANLSGFLFGFWTLALAVGNYLAARVAAVTVNAASNAIDYSSLFLIIFAAALGGAMTLLLTRKLLCSLTK